MIKSMIARSEMINQGNFSPIENIDFRSQDNL
jgi:hypothetical protein